jgi:fatty-acyl-CoA synthase
MSAGCKARIVATFPNVLVNDGFGSSEAGIQGSSRVTAADAPEAGGTVRFSTASAKPMLVLDDHDRPVVPGDGVVGRIVTGGHLPLGYYNDPEKTAATFVEKDGVRWVLTGDVATVLEDGTIQLFGRGSMCINTGGEKVFPEEVEEALKQHPAIFDAVVVGVPDEKFGEAITAMVEATPGAAIDEADVIAHMKSKLAAYKAPKRVLTVDTIGRAANGKVDYKRLKAESIAIVG